MTGVPAKALTFQEFVTENDGASKKQYLKYIKDRIANTMAKASSEMVVESIVQTKDITRPITMEKVCFWCRTVNGEMEQSLT